MTTTTKVSTSLVSFKGRVPSFSDALLILEGCRRGLLPMCTRRLSSKERKEIQCGDVFVFEESVSRIKRWADGRLWSSSRVKDCFLIYVELGLTSNVAGFSRHVPSLSPILRKKVLTITTSGGERLRLVAYSNALDNDAANPTHPDIHGLTPRSDTRLLNLKIPSGIFCITNAQKYTNNVIKTLSDEQPTIPLINGPSFSYLSVPGHPPRGTHGRADSVSFSLDPSSSGVALGSSAAATFAHSVALPVGQPSLSSILGQSSPSSTHDQSSGHSSNSVVPMLPRFDSAIADPTIQFENPCISQPFAATFHSNYPAYQCNSQYPQPCAPTTWRSFDEFPDPRRAPYYNPSAPHQPQFTANSRHLPLLLPDPMLRSPLFNAHSLHDHRDRPRFRELEFCTPHPQLQQKFVYLPRVSPPSPRLTFTSVSN